MFENGTFNVYSPKGEIIGKIKIGPNADFIKSEIEINGKKYNVTRHKWETSISDGDNILYHLKTDPIWGIMVIEELNKKIKGVWGLKWGTQLIDENGKTLLKIRNENKFINNGNYVIKLENEILNPMDILISLYGHLYGSSMKQKSVIIGILGRG